MRSRRRNGTAVARAAALVLAAALVAGCESNPGAVPPPQDVAGPRTAVDRTLTFGVFGPDEEVNAYRSLVSVYNSLYDAAEMEVEAYSSRREFMQTVRETGEVPDVFLAPGSDLMWLEDEGVLQPVDQLLVERGVDFGDLYSRDSVLAFSAESRLQCMPVGISPMVMFYNTELVDFDAMERRGLPVPGEERVTWNFEAFTAAAEFASRPARRTKGIYVEPSLGGLAPWIYAADGQVFDSQAAPTRLTFSDEATQAALATLLPVLRDPRLTLTPEQLERRSPVEWFERGRLAMLPGHRSLVPRLRMQEGLQFDVIQLPSVERTATTAEVTGMCVSAETGNLPAAADFLVHMANSVSVRRVASEGYLVPANLEVAFSNDFVQPGRAPDHPQAFTNAIRSVVLAPLLADEPGLEVAVGDELEELLLAPVLTDLVELSSRIDRESRLVLDPEGLAEEESGSPSDDATSSP